MMNGAPTFDAMLDRILRLRREDPHATPTGEFKIGCIMLTLLRSDLHRLYDRGYVTVTPDLVFRVGDRLRAEFKNGKSYYGLSGQRIRCPDAATLRPRRELLEWHGKEVFRG